MKNAKSHLAAGLGLENTTVELTVKYIAINAHHTERRFLILLIAFHFLPHKL
jgi:hypothetical protein